MLYVGKWFSGLLDHSGLAKHAVGHPIARLFHHDAALRA